MHAGKSIDERMCFELTIDRNEGAVLPEPHFDGIDSLIL
jgi:hypothetical protein